jgi:hypothetical protein
MELSTVPPAVPEFLQRSSSYMLSCDLGQSQDPTAIAVIEKKVGVLDFRSEFDRHCEIAGPPQKPHERFEVVHLERIPLGTSYPVVVERVAFLLQRPPLNDKNCELAIDETGVGRAVGDIFVASGLKPIRVTITGGNETTPQGQNRWHVSKTALISRLDALLHTGALLVADELPEAVTLREEFKNFQRRLSDSGKPSYSARVGQHDDLLLAVCIGLWAFGRPRGGKTWFGTYGHHGITIFPNQGEPHG